MRLLTAALLILLATLAPADAETRLVMLEQPGCHWCQRFDAEIAGAYEKSPEGRIAPLRRVDITRDWPEDLATIAPDRYTPTFILIDDGVEIARLRGYPGDNWFWPMLEEMLDKLDGRRSG
ncbi:MAG: hypothetical protein AB7L41_00985 [Flavobacteriaceae bacterium]